MIPAIELDLIQTLAVAAFVFYAGVFLKHKVKVLDALNIPSAVIGGLLFAFIVLILRDNFVNLHFETSAQGLFNVTFFTTIGMGASILLLKRGGLQVVSFLIISTVFCVVQNLLGLQIASWLHVNPLLGVIAGSVTLVGGPATGLAFAPLFEQAGVAGADVVALTAATFGIISGGIIGGPVGTWLIKRYHLKKGTSATSRSFSGDLVEWSSGTLSIDPSQERSHFILNLLLVAICMGIGSILSNIFQSWGWTLPAYIGAMLVAAIARSIDDSTGWFKIRYQSLELIGMVSLNIFLVVALMNLKLWQLVHLALPLSLILIAQVVVASIFALSLVYRLMGRDYDAAVMSSGFIGFVLGTTANAVANMKTLESKYGLSPRAFLVVPMVGAFFIDFTNAIIITLFLNWMK